MEDYGAITTAVSKSEGRMKVMPGCEHGKKKCLKCAMKKDGKGGPGINIPGYGATKAQTTIKSKGKAVMSKLRRSSKISGGLKMKKIKTLSSITKSFGKKMKFGKVVKGGKSKNLKALLKTII